MSEQMISDMLNHRESSLDERIKLALDLTEDFVGNHAHGIDDQFMDRLKEHFSEAEIVELTIGFID